MKNFKQFLFLSILCSLVLFTNCGDGDDPVADTPTNTTDDGSIMETGFIYVDENGVTIKAGIDAVVGESYELDGVSYLVVDSTMLYDMVVNDEDVTKVVTSKVTNMRDMFNDATSFNQDISSWDVNNVTECENFSLDATAWTLPKPNFTNCRE